jgi:hypothetical protein
MIYTDNLNIYLQKKGDELLKIRFQGKWWNRLALIRIIARLLRSDQFNIITLFEKKLIYVLRDGSLYYLRLDTLPDAKFIAKLPFRGTMHNAHCILPNGNILFGAYSNGKKQSQLKLYSIDTKNNSLEEIENLDTITAQHIHAVRWDEISKTIWICTGDADGECYIILMNENYQIIKILGDGSQTYRTCDFIFLTESVVWAMDSPLKQSYVVKYNRKTNNIIFVQNIEGPGWYTVRANGYYFLSIASEPGKAVKTAGPIIMISADGEKWEIYEKFIKDFWPSLFKFGVCEIGSSDNFHIYVNHQATKYHDGNAEVYRIANNGVDK